MYNIKRRIFLKLSGLGSVSLAMPNLLLGPKKEKNQKNEKYFSDMVAYMDKIIGRIVNKLDELHLRENTLILFIGDNGTHRRIRSKIGDQWVQGGKSYTTDA